MLLLLLLLKSTLSKLIFILNLARPGSAANRPRMAAHLNVALPYLKFGVLKLEQGPSKYSSQVQ